jgi:hypothetical protein
LKCGTKYKYFIPSDTYDLDIFDKGYDWTLQARCYQVDTWYKVKSITFIRYVIHLISQEKNI